MSSTSMPAAQSVSDSQSPNPAIVKYPRTLTVDAAVPAGTQFSQTMTIPQDADFEWDWVSVFRTSGLLKLIMSEYGTGSRPLILGVSNQNPFQGIFIDLFAGLTAGNAAFPMIIPFVMPANRSYNHQFTDSSGALNTVQIAYIGSALFKVSGTAPSGGSGS
jgi:hypothetical protein